MPTPYLVPNDDFAYKEPASAHFNTCEHTTDGKRSRRTIRVHTSVDAPAYARADWAGDKKPSPQDPYQHITPS